jgi:hypothetical protein
MKPRSQRNGGSNGTPILICLSCWNARNRSGGRRARAGYAAGNAWVRTWRWDWRWNRGHNWSGPIEPTRCAGDRQMAAKHTAAEYPTSRWAGRTSANQSRAEPLRWRCVALGCALRSATRDRSRLTRSRLRNAVQDSPARGVSCSVNTQGRVECVGF